MKKYLIFNSGFIKIALVQVFLASIFSFSSGLRDWRIFLINIFLILLTFLLSKKIVLDWWKSDIVTVDFTK